MAGEIQRISAACVALFAKGIPVPISEEIYFLPIYVTILLKQY